MSCCSRVTRSTLSSERKRYSVCVPLRRLRSFVCTMPRQFPGVTWTTFMTRQRSFWCWMIMPTRSCVAGINMETEKIAPERLRGNSRTDNEPTEDGVGCVPARRRREGGRNRGSDGQLPPAWEVLEQRGVAEHRQPVEQLAPLRRTREERVEEGHRPLDGAELLAERPDREPEGLLVRRGEALRLLVAGERAFEGARRVA